MTFYQSGWLFSILVIFKLQISQIFGIFLNKVLITCSLSNNKYILKGWIKSKISDIIPKPQIKLSKIWSWILLWWVLTRLDLFYNILNWPTSLELAECSYNICFTWMNLKVKQKIFFFSNFFIHKFPKFRLTTFDFWRKTLLFRTQQVRNSIT